MHNYCIIVLIATANTNITGRRPWYLHGHFRNTTDQHHQEIAKWNGSNIQTHL